MEYAFSLTFCNGTVWNMHSHTGFAMAFYGRCIIIETEALQLDFIEYAFSLGFCNGLLWKMHSHTCFVMGFYGICILTLVLQWDFVEDALHCGFAIRFYAVSKLDFMEYAFSLMFCSWISLNMHFHCSFAM